MSSQFAISAAFSILMMASYVLFGTESARVPLATPLIERLAQSVTQDLPGPEQVSDPSG